MLLLTDQLQEVELYLTAPLYIYDAKEISLFDKLLFTSIYGLTKSIGSTKMTDKYFIVLLSKSKKTIAKSMKRLDDNGYIERETFFNRKEKKRSRKIKLIRKVAEKKTIHAPIEIYLHDLTDGAKMLLIQLVGLSKKDGYTFVTNKELAEKLNSSSRQIRRYLKQLKENDFIFLENEKSANRLIKVNDRLKDNSVDFEGNNEFSNSLEKTKEVIRVNFEREKNEKMYSYVDNKTDDSYKDDEDINDYHKRLFF